MHDAHAPVVQTRHHNACPIDTQILVLCLMVPLPLVQFLMVPRPLSSVPYGAPQTGSIPLIEGPASWHLGRTMAISPLLNPLIVLLNLPLVPILLILSSRVPLRSIAVPKPVTSAAHQFRYEISVLVVSTCASLSSSTVHSVRFTCIF